MTLQQKLEQLPFKKEVEEQGASIYAVGGAVRDEIMGIKSKDLDLLILKMPLDEITRILEKHGKVDAVGQSFGILKYQDKVLGEIDVAIPRTEKKTGQAHTAFEVVSDPNLPIEDDLKRRDFTINAIAMGTDGKHVDPYQGISDIKFKIIKAVSAKTFSEDPLRMLRAVQFVSRFVNFKIHTNTEAMITANANKIQFVSKERVLIELEKIATKGSAYVAGKHLHSTGLFNYIFPANYGLATNVNLQGDLVKTLAELIFFLTEARYDMNFYFRDEMKADRNSVKELEALIRLDAAIRYSAGPRRVRMFEAFAHYPAVINTFVFKKFKHLHDDLDLFLRNKLPKNLAEIKCDGYTIMQFGIKGAAIGEWFKRIVREILFSRLENTKDAILKYLTENITLTK